MSRIKDTARDQALGEAFATLTEPGPREPEENPTRLRLLAAATELFAEKGYQGATTRELAKRAGVTEKTLFTHFHAKSELFVAAISPGLGGLMGTAVFRDLAASMAGAETIGERLKLAALNRARFASEHTGLMKSVIQETLLSPHFRDELKAYFTEHLLPVARMMIAGSTASGQLRPLQPDRVLRVFMSTVIGYLVTRHILLPEQEFDDEAEVDATLDIVLNGIVPPRQ